LTNTEDITLQIKRKFSQLQNWFVHHQVAFIPLMLALLAGALLGYAGGNHQLMEQLRISQQQSQQQQLQLAQQAGIQAELTKKLDFAQADLAVEKDTNKLLQDDVKAQQDQVFQLKRQLALMEKIVAPPSAAGSLAIEKFSIRATSKPGSFRYSLTVVEQNRQKKLTKAQFELNLQGIKWVKKKARKIEFDGLKLANTSKKQRSLQIKGLLTVEGEFTLPKGVEWQQLEIQLLSNSGQGQSTVTLSKQIPWNGTSEIVE